LKIRKLQIKSAYITALKGDGFRRWMLNIFRESAGCRIESIYRKSGANHIAQNHFSSFGGTPIQITYCNINPIVSVNQTKASSRPDVTFPSGYTIVTNPANNDHTKQSRKLHLFLITLPSSLLQSFLLPHHWLSTTRKGSKTAEKTPSLKKYSLRMLLSRLY
jgi:hypothetical protein